MAAGNIGRTPVAEAAPSAEPGDGGNQSGAPEEEDGEDGADAQPGPDFLRRKWLDEVALVKRLAKHGMAENHPAIVAAQQARDAAEAAWRQAKLPAPLPTRLKWAQDKLNRALELQSAASAAVQHAEDEHKRIMAQLHERCAEAQDRVNKRRLAVEALQEEVSSGLPARRPRAAPSAELQVACGGLCNSVGRELVALVELLQEGSAERQAANQVLATLATSQRRVEEAFGWEEQQPQEFDIGEDGDNDDAMSGMSEWSESHELRDTDGGVGDAPQNAQGVGSDGRYDGTAHAGVGQEAGGWSRWGDDRWHAPHWHADRHGRWHRESWADHWEAERQQSPGWGSGQQADAAQGTRRVGGSHDDSSGEPSAKQRRQHDTDRAMEPEGGTSANAGTGASAGAQVTVAPAATTAGTESAGTDAATAYARQVTDVVNRAIDMGIQPLTEEGEELITLTPEQLSRWVETRLASSHTR